jgi:hypothetical protein
MTHDQKSDERSASDELNDLHRHAEPKGASDTTGEDEGSTAKEGNEDHLKPDQKTTPR